MMKEFVGNDGLLHCAKCGEVTEKELNFPLLDGNGGTEKRKVPVSCRCRREAREDTERRLAFEESQRQISKLRSMSLMDARLKDVNFATYKMTEENAKALSLAQKYVDRFDEMYEKGQGLLFWGDVGTGKTFVAAVIANELLDRLTPVVMTSFIKLLDIMGNFESADEDFLDRLNKAKLLVIDDLGAERGSDFALEKVYDIIDSRYRTGKPMILTTNLTLQYMQSCEDIRYNRIYDRIYEMCYPFKMNGMSWRKKEAVARFDTMKQLLEG